MKFYTVTDKTESTAILKQDYQSGREIGALCLGEHHLFFRKGWKVFYISYPEITCCFRRVMLVPMKLCCGQGDMAVEHLVIADEEREIAQILLPGERASKAVMEELKKRAPQARFTAPVKEKKEGVEKS